MVVKSQSTLKFASGITGVPFGRTEVLIGAIDAPSPELSHGHGLKGACFHGVSKSLDLHDFPATWKT